MRPCRYLDASVERIELPLGLGSRHLAAASVSQRLGAIAIVVSESGVVRVFHEGRLEATVIPELWLLDRLNAQLGRHDVKELHRSVDELSVSVGPVHDEARVDVAGVARDTRGETTNIRLTS